MTYEEAVSKIRPGCYRYKETDYEVLHIAKLKESSEPLVIYREIYGKSDILAEPISSWSDRLNHGKESGSVVHVTEASYMEKRQGLKDLREQVNRQILERIESYYVDKTERRSTAYLSVSALSPIIRLRMQKEGFDVPPSYKLMDEQYYVRFWDIADQIFPVVSKRHITSTHRKDKEDLREDLRRYISERITEYGFSGDLPKTRYLRNCFLSTIYTRMLGEGYEKPKRFQNFTKEYLHRALKVADSILPPLKKNT